MRNGRTGMSISVTFKTFWVFPVALVMLRSQGSAKAAWIDLGATLRSARVIANVEIVEYTPDGLKARAQSKSGELLNFKRLGDVLKHAVTLKANQYPLTGQWPPKGSKVLLVAGPENTVALFAVRTGADLRFWSPYKTDSVAAFECTPPARPLPGHTDQISGTNPSWDGCLVNGAELDQLIGKDFSQRKI